MKVILQLNVEMWASGGTRSSGQREYISHRRIVIIAFCNNAMFVNIVADDSL
jgi:hypothetical protein